MSRRKGRTFALSREKRRVLSRANSVFPSRPRRLLLASPLVLAPSSVCFSFSLSLPAAVASVIATVGLRGTLSKLICRGALRPFFFVFPFVFHSLGLSVPFFHLFEVAFVMSPCTVLLLCSCWPAGETAGESDRHRYRQQVRDRHNAGTPRHTQAHLTLRYRGERG